MRDTLHDRDGGSGVHAPSSKGSLFVRVNVAAIAVAAVGLLLPKVTAGGSGLATLRTGYGQVVALLLLLVCAALSGWYAARADWSMAALLFVAWLGLLATAAFEVVRVATASSTELGLTRVGAGLYCNVVGAVVGAAAATIEAVRQWTAGRTPGSGSDRWAPWAAAGAVTVATLAVVGVTGRLAGHDALLASARAALTIPSLAPGASGGGSSSPDQSLVEGRRPVTLPAMAAGAPTTAAAAPAPTSGVTGAPDAVAGGVSASGDSGNSGDWGMQGGLATYWPGYTGAPGSFYIWPGYLGPAGDTGATGGSGPTVTGASGLTGSGVTGATGPTATGTTGTG